MLFRSIAADLVKIGIDKKSVENRTLLAELNAYFKAGQANEAIKRIEKYIAVASPGPKEYEFLSNYVKQKTADKTALSKAAEWGKKSK